MAASLSAPRGEADGGRGVRVRNPAAPGGRVTSLAPFGPAHTSTPVTLLPASDRSWRRFFAYDPLPVGGVAVALMLGTTALLGTPTDGPLLGAAFCGAALVYLADRALGLSPEDRYNQPDRLAWVRHHRWGLLIEGLGLGCGLLVLLPLLQSKTVLAALALGAGGGLHVFRRGVVEGFIIGLLEPVLVALVWAIGAVLLPVLEAGGPALSGAVVALTAYRGLLILPNVLLVDWADRKGDAAAGTGSWAVGRSRRSVQRAATGLVLLAVGGAGAAVGTGWAPPLLLIDAAGGLFMIWGIWGLRPEHSALHRAVLDGIVAWPVVPWLLSVASAG